MKKFVFLLVSLAITSCSGISGVTYSKVNMKPLDSGKTVALAVKLPVGEGDPFWLEGQRKLRSKLGVILVGEGIFREVVTDNEPADYRLDVQIADIAIGRLEIDRPDLTNSADTAQRIGHAIGSFIDGYREIQAPEQLRALVSYITLHDIETGHDVLAFKMSAEAGQTEATTTSAVSRIVAGVRCFGEDCV